ncbi:uncharacterized protein B0H18DRAFT_873866 [Fomitopsis serialis]|uniref:uncharacterized protein n=1 Tax=Fomitopsis serialis TaxID=139415 RepID=UPI0020078EC1|nr:uncharacterized protein B0H18DRAFT_873866 [Neoantrodia serialis]KAH9929428.1 hypothetical protein B0H18DRAFT_873866 [Neoantrodia serialis]
MREDAVVTTPNAAWMPEFPVAAPGLIGTRADGRWGPQEYSIWPQLYHPRVLHHACIPAKGGHVDILPITIESLWEPLSSDDWASDAACGVPDLGFLNASRLLSLKYVAHAVYGRFVNSRADAKAKAFGRHLHITIEQALDRLTVLPTWRAHTIAVAAHIQRLCLELCGLVLLFEIVQPRISNTHYIAAAPLAVRGAFTNNASTAQVLFRLGIPVWYIQPLTKTLRIIEVVDVPTSISTVLSLELSQPRLHGTGDLAGIVQHPGDWPFAMQQEVLKSLLDARLPPLPKDECPAPEVPPAKKAREEPDRDEPRANAAGGSSRRKPTHRGKRSQPIAPAPAPHPSLYYQPPTIAVVPNVWADCLRSTPTLSPPATPSTYYWPPPFLFEGVGDKTKRYLHNYIRIRGFCRQRLLDPTIGGEPLRISEWRDALWGDYAVRGDEVMRPDVTKRSKERRQVQQNIRRLFSKAAGLPTYHEALTVQWGDTVATLSTLDNVMLKRRILWEIHEVNWRCELRELDAVLTDSRQWGTLQQWEREARVCRVWGADSSGLRVVPLWEDGVKPRLCWIDSPNIGWETCRVALAEIVGVMARWSKLPELLKISQQEVLSSDADRFLHLQKTAITFYIQSFLAVFHRLPVPPAVLPENGFRDRSVVYNV